MSVDTSLQDDALRLAELERKVVRAFIVGDTEELVKAVSAFVELRKTLQIRLLDESAISVTDANAAAALRKMRALPLLDRNPEGFGGIEEIDGLELSELGLDDVLYSWFGPVEYIRGLAELRPLIVRAAVPEFVSQLVNQVKNCYAFQQDQAAYTLCRVVIEAAVRDICVRRRLFPDLGDNVVLFEKYKWQELRNKVSSGPLRERLRVLYAELSTVVHGRKSVTREEARKAFEETLEVVEQLYAANGL